ncbi:MAG: bacillithiol system redox-active protein YtxJ [Bacteroidetes bacterium]|nr:bacillithiol system redox-active protein YtxJ [Bacteroidota bacterium]
MNWIALTDIGQLDEIIRDSARMPVAIFKHSTRCSISAMVKRALERDWTASADTLPVYYLDLIAFRPISNEIARRFEVIHESPQMLLIKEGKVAYHASHSEIDVADMMRVA